MRQLVSKLAASLRLGRARRRARAAQEWTPPAADSTALEAILREVAAEYGQPAIAAAVIRGEEVTAHAVSGRAVANGEAPVSLASRFHVGSTTKAMTATLIARLVQEGHLAWATTLRDALPGVPMRADYERVSVRDLLLSRAGVLAFQSTETEDERAVQALWHELPATSSEPAAQRAAMTRFALATPPIAPPGSRSIYSNVGWSILGHVAEVAGGEAYERLLTDRLLRPLGMAGTRIGGWPASIADQDQPRGHYPPEEPGGVPRPQGLDDAYIFPDWMNPAGGVHCPISDYAAFARDQLLGLEGRGAILGASGYRELHLQQARIDLETAYPGQGHSGVMDIGYGWGVVDTGEGMLSVADGSGGTFYARLAIYPPARAAFAGATNTGDGVSALNEVIRRATGFELA